jgi:hypothetical protein
MYPPVRSPARQSRSLRAVQSDPVTAEPHLADAVAGRGAYGGADAVRELRVDERDRRRHVKAGQKRNTLVVLIKAWEFNAHYWGHFGQDYSQHPALWLRFLGFGASGF